MKQEALETLPAAPRSTEWDGLSKLPFAGESKETLIEERFDSSELPLSNDPKLRIAQEKFLRDEPLSIFEKMYDRNGEAITTNIDGYELKTDHAYRVVSDELYDRYCGFGMSSR